MKTPKAIYQQQFRSIVKTPERVNLSDVKLPSLPLVEVSDDVIKGYPEVYEKYKNRRFIVLGEITQMPGHVTMVDIRTGEIIPVIHDNDLEMLTPEEA